MNYSVLLKDSSSLAFRLHKIIRSLRVFNTRSMILMYALGRVLAGKSYLQIDTLLVWCAFICTYSVASLYNYIADTKIDSENNKYNPINSNVLSINGARILSYSAIVFSIVLVALTNNKIINGVGIITLTILSIVYSHPKIAVQTNPIGKVVTMWLNYALVPMCIGLSLHADSSSVVVAACISLLYLFWLPYSDIPDINGDKKYGKITLAIKLGVPRLTLVIAIVSSIFSYLVIKPIRVVCGEVLYPQIILICILVFEWAIVIDNNKLKSKRTRVLAGYLLFALLISLIYYC